ncbi:MAG: hypothetical protein Q9N02_04010, partial [Ghiorsea sp.]|nr:hypothetical protein [Ghiorsea sp.]
TTRNPALWLKHRDEASLFQHLATYCNHCCPVLKGKPVIFNIPKYSRMLWLLACFALNALNLGEGIDINKLTISVGFVTC